MITRERAMEIAEGLDYHKTLSELNVTDDEVMELAYLYGQEEEDEQK